MEINPRQITFRGFAGRTKTKSGRYVVCAGPIGLRLVQINLPSKFAENMQLSWAVLAGGWHLSACKPGWDRNAVKKLYVTYATFDAGWKIC